MRNLKRALSLTLASVMLLGMMVFGTSAASFTDADQISNVTAATVLQELEVMQGSNGKFSPNQTVTRGQMAILICKMLYGSKLNADNFAGTSEFTDVPANAYYTGYVNLASQLGIISGYGNGKFGPGSPVTTAQAALMITKALGWFQAGELENQSWTSNAIAAVERATTVNLFGDLKLANNEPLSRDNVCEMVFNAMTKTAPVKYNERWGMYYSDEGNIVSGVKFDYRNTLGYTNFDLVYNDRDKKDDFGRPSTEWGIGTVNGLTDDKGNIVSSTIRTSFIKAPDAADATYTAKVKSKDLYTDLGLDKTTAATLIVDGKDQPDFTVKKGDDTKLADSGNGVLVQAYKDKDNNVKIIVINTFVGKVNSIIKATSSADRSVSIELLGNNYGTNLKTKFETESFVEDDVVMYTAAYNGSKYDIKTMELLTNPATGTLTKWVGTSIDGSKGGAESNFTVENDTYKYSDNAAIVNSDGIEQLISAFAVKDSELNVYLDKYGYALYVSGVEGEKNYAAVIGVGNNNPYGDKTNGVTLLLPDGTQKTVTAKLATGSFMVGADGTVGSNVLDPFDTAGPQLVNDRKGDLVSYTVDDDGTYKLTVLNYKDSDGNAVYTGNYATTNIQYTGENASNDASASYFTNGKSGIQLGGTTYYVTSDTLFFVATADGTGAAYNVYTGFNAMPSFGQDSASKISGYAFKTRSEYAYQLEAVYIDARNVAGVSSVDTYFVKAEDAKVTTDKKNGVSYYVLPAVVDGEITEVMIAVDATCTNAPVINMSDNANLEGVFGIKNVIKNKDGVITSFANANAFDVANKETGTIRNGLGLLGFGNKGVGDSSTEYWVSEKANVYKVNEDYDTIVKVGPSSIVTDTNDIAYAKSDKDHKILDDVFIVEQDDGDGSNTNPIDVSDIKPLSSDWNPVSGAITVSDFEVKDGVKFGLDEAVAAVAKKVLDEHPTWVRDAASDVFSSPNYTVAFKSGGAPRTATFNTGKVSDPSLIKTVTTNAQLTAALNDVNTDIVVINDNATLPAGITTVSKELRIAEGVTVTAQDGQTLTGKLEGKGTIKVKTATTGTLTIDSANVDKNLTVDTNGGEVTLGSSTTTMPKMTGNGTVKVEGTGVGANGISDPLDAADNLVDQLGGAEISVAAVTGQTVTKEMFVTGVAFAKESGGSIVSNMTISSSAADPYIIRIKLSGFNTTGAVTGTIAWDDGTTPLSPSPIAGEFGTGKVLTDGSANLVMTINPDAASYGVLTFTQGSTKIVVNVKPPVTE